MGNETKTDYIKELLSVVNEDKKSVLLYVAFDLAVVSLVLSEKLFQGPEDNSRYVVLGLICLLISAFFFFNYYRKMHLACFELAEQLLSMNTDEAKKIPSRIWAQHKLGYQVGYAIRIFGLGTLLWVYANG